VEDLSEMKLANFEQFRYQHTRMVIKRSIRLAQNQIEAMPKAVLKTLLSRRKLL
jgi:hypothetical protein